jgi:hypothetical protein
MVDAGLVGCDVVVVGIVDAIVATAAEGALAMAGPSDAGADASLALSAGTAGV